MTWLGKILQNLYQSAVDLPHQTPPETAGTVAAWLAILVFLISSVQGIWRLVLRLFSKMLSVRARYILGSRLLDAIRFDPSVETEEKVIQHIKKQFEIHRDHLK